MIHQLIQTPLIDLQSEAFAIRKAHFGNELTFSIPGTVSYHDNTFPSQKREVRRGERDRDPLRSAMRSLPRETSRIHDSCRRP